MKLNFTPAGATLRPVSCLQKQNIICHLRARYKLHRDVYRDCANGEPIEPIPEARLPYRPKAPKLNSENWKWWGLSK